MRVKDEIITIVQSSFETNSKVRTEMQVYFNFRFCRNRKYPRTILDFHAGLKYQTLRTKVFIINHKSLFEIKHDVDDHFVKSPEERGTQSEKARKEESPTSEQTKQPTQTRQTR